ncbi:efflux RND transporter permease subunit [Agarilytica rhodophyticola]|uniref:efflux RND transporter permease subunit n=1 Tax=Agarilytica rhodophyticola TaxID=1737490 RepID=UPI000B341FE3|nr:efflux RND transporter permease subunit [Agarilytica rhodophyticola]
MSIAEYAITKKTISWMITLLLLIGGIVSFNDLGRLEDPAFTIKQAVVITQYPGASALEIEEEVTLPIENAIQQLPYVDKVISTSTPGLSQVEVEMKSIYRKDDLAQIWDEMRRKINDMQGQLPPGARMPIVNDDFGDVYGVFFAITGEGYSYHELSDYTDFLSRELVLVEGVGKVSIGGRLDEQVFIEIDRAKLSASGFSADSIRQLLTGQNLVNDAGHIEVGSEYLRIKTKSLSGDGLAALNSLLLGSSNGRLVYLSDVANLSRGYKDPARHLYRFNGKQALTLGVSFASGVNVVEVGKNITERLSELEYARPIGMQLQAIYDQPAQVESSVDNFIIGLGQAVVIVIVVLMFTMGWRPGVIMSLVLLLTIAGTFIVMGMFDINLHRISLGALIIALGMLVDNAIVITEGILISVQRGESRLQSAIRIVSHTRLPLLGATIIAITAFAPIGLSPDASGEFTGSLFWVLFISLLFSWVLAVSLTPFFCYLLFQENAQQQEEQNDPYAAGIYLSYRKLLDLTLKFRKTTMMVMFGLLVSALIAFTNVKQAFFPDSSLPMFLVDYWLPEGSSIQSTEADIKSLEKALLNIPEIKQVTATIGQGAQRFMLTYTPEKTYPSYAQLMIQTHSYDQLEGVREKVDEILFTSYPQAFTRFNRISIGPATAAKIEARLIGPDPKVLRSLGQEIIALLNSEPDAINIRQDWRERTKVVQPVFDDAAARRLGISQADLDVALNTNVSGQQVGTYRHGSEILPIIIRPPEKERRGIDQLEQVQVYSPVTQSYINIGQFVRGIDLNWEDPIIKRRDRKRTLAVLADPGPNSNAFALHQKIRGSIEAIELPVGYSLQWGGEFEAQEQANEAVFAFLPLGLLVMIVITVFMFNSVKQTLVIWITIPLAIIGVAYGLLLTSSAFSFTALLAVLSLIGMQIKNGIVLVEEIKRLKEEENFDWYQAICDAAVSRLRPVSMAALTTILGMIPLLTDVFFQPMAVTIMFGLGFATILTLIVVPVLFALFYSVKNTQ